MADIDYVTTLAGYIQWKMTGERVVGVGEASGIFPIDSETNTYFADMIAKFDEAVADKAYSWKALDVLPHVLTAGDNAGVLTKKVPHFSTCPEIWKQAFRSARRREMPEQVWQQQTASASEPETCLPELPFLL